jgi:hypothetical protein
VISAENGFFIGKVLLRRRKWGIFSGESKWDWSVISGGGRKMASPPGKISSASRGVGGRRKQSKNTTY